MKIIQPLAKFKPKLLNVPVFKLLSYFDSSNGQDNKETEINQRVEKNNDFAILGCTTSGHGNLLIMLLVH